MVNYIFKIYVIKFEKLFQHFFEEGITFKNWYPYLFQVTEKSSKLRRPHFLSNVNTALKFLQSKKVRKENGDPRMTYFVGGSTENCQLPVLTLQPKNIPT